MKKTGLFAMVWTTFAAAIAHSQQPAQDAPLPAGEQGGIVIDITESQRDLYRIALPRPLGDSQSAGVVQSALRADFALVPNFQVLEERAFIADLAAEGLGIGPAQWRSIGARGVVKAEAVATGDQLRLEMRFYEVSAGAEPAVSRTFEGPKVDARRFAHRFANEILAHLTGRGGVFGTKLLFARATGPGCKDIFHVDMDGFGLTRITKAGTINLLPAWGPAESIFYTSFKRMKPEIFRHGQETPIFGHPGMNSGVQMAPSGDRMAVVLSRDGNPEIYTARPDGSDLRRLTNHPGIDVSPAFSPDGRQIAFVSNRGGSPQIYLMSAEGGDARRITFAGTYNQQPTWCGGPDPTIVFTGRDETTFDLFRVTTQGAMTRLTQDQGRNMDPACSPDGRMVAFYSSRGGVYVMNQYGYHQTLVLRGHAESIRWGMTLP